MTDKNTIEYLREINKHMDYTIDDLGDGRVRIASQDQQFDFEFDSIKEALAFITDIN
jgi:hypothetical protein